MRKFKNKKLVTTIVAFLMVFVMAGAFASFQALLNINARVNMYSPTVDAIIAEFANVAEPLGGPGEEPIFRPGAPRFVGRDTPANLTTALGQFGGAQAWSFRWANATATGPAPDPGMIHAGAIVAPRDFQTLYVMVNFDNFVQTYDFEFALANVGVVPLTVQSMTVEAVTAADFSLPPALVNLTPDTRNDDFLDFINVGGNYGTLVGTTIAPADPTSAIVDRVNYSATVNVSFGVDLGTWTIWAADLSEDEIEEAELFSRDLIFRIRYTVVPQV